MAFQEWHWFPLGYEWDDPSQEDHHATPTRAFGRHRPEDGRDALKWLLARTGKVINIYGEMGHSPAVLDAYVAMNEANRHSMLDRPTRQSVRLEAERLAAPDECAWAGRGYRARRKPRTREGEVPTHG